VDSARTILFFSDQAGLLTYGSASDAPSHLSGGILKNSGFLHHCPRSQRRPNVMEFNHVPFSPFLLTRTTPDGL